MADHTVRRRGTDSSGRGIYASDYMWEWWLGVLAELSFTPTIVQGAWMTLAGGGADVSAGYHDGGGCFDIRTRDLTPAQVGEMVRTTRRRGAGGWVRDAAHGGMDPHFHLVLGSDFDLDDGAAWQWREYLAGRDGLSSQGQDYHWRPKPIVTKPPEADDMFSDEDRTLLREAKAAAERAATHSEKARQGAWNRDQRLITKLAAVGVDVRQIEAAVAELDAEDEENEQ